MEHKKKTSKNEWSPAPRKDSDKNYSKKTESKEKQDEPKKKTSKHEFPSVPRKDYGGKFSKETMAPEDKSKPTPKKVIAKPVDSKKINDKKTGSSGKKNPHTPSSKERIY
jgi:hypothetical protein